MLQSHLNSEINYSEDRELDDSDIDFDAQMWSYEIMGVEVYIALGQKHTIDNIDTFAIYLIKDDIVDSKIGLFEVIDSDTYRDSDVDIDRGINSAFQNHLQMGEIKNMSDLINYGNGYYKIIK